MRSRVPSEIGFARGSAVLAGFLIGLPTAFVLNVEVPRVLERRSVTGYARPDVT